ncbi:MAG: WbqC family protein [Luteibaculaceae bacterium]
MSKVVAIHQPNLFPWLGYFAKIKDADVFVFLDHTVNNRKEATYTRRVEVLDSNKNRFFITLPIHKIESSDFGPLNKWQVNFGVKGFPDKLLTTLEQAYKKHRFFDDVWPFVVQFFSEVGENKLTEANKNFITAVSKQMGFTTKFEDTTSYSFNSNSTQLLVDIVKHFNGNVYLSGKGGDKYQDEEVFNQHNIILKRQDFQHAVYPQYKSIDFKPGLSIIDCLMNVGFTQTSQLL